MGCQLVPAATIPTWRKSNTCNVTTANRSSILLPHVGAARTAAGKKHAAMGFDVYSHNRQILGALGIDVNDGPPHIVSATLKLTTNSLPILDVEYKLTDVDDQGNFLTILRQYELTERVEEQGNLGS